MAILPTKYSAKTRNAAFIGTNAIVLSIDANENPTLVIDSFKEDTNQFRTVGADLTTDVTRQYAVSKTQQLSTVVTVNGITTNTIEYNIPQNYANDFFETGFDPVLVLCWYGVSGLANLAPADRKISFEFTDDQGQVYGPGAANDVPDFEFTLRHLETGNVDLTGYDSILVVPLNELQQSTSLKFTNLKVTFSFPVGSVFSIRNLATYSSQENCQFLGYSDMIFNDPRQYSNQKTNNIGRVQGSLGNTINLKNRIGENTISFETQTFDPEEYRICRAEPRIRGGIRTEYNKEITIPGAADDYVIESLGNLQNVESTEDIWITIRDENGNEEKATIYEGGQYMSAGQVRFIKEGAKKLLFSSEDEGKTAVISYNYTDIERFKSIERAGSKTVFGTMWVLNSNSTDFGTSSAQTQSKYSNISITVSKINAAMDNDEADRMKIDIGSISESAATVIAEESY